MPTVHQKWPGDEISLGDLGQSSVKTDYVIKGAADEWTAWAALNLATTTPAGGIAIYAERLVRGQVEITGRLAGDEWEGSVSWKSRQSQQEIVDQDGMTWQLETGGGTAKITNSLATVRYGTKAAAIGETVINPKDDDKEPEGVDITVPVTTWTETWKFPASSIPFAYVVILTGLTGRTNGDTFRGFAPGEVLFQGASGGKQQENEMQFSYKFAASPNVTGLTIGGISGISKDGWAYLEVRHENVLATEDGGGKRMAKSPVAVYSHKVYPAGNFSLLQIGG